MSEAQGPTAEQHAEIAALYDRVQMIFRENGQSQIIGAALIHLVGYYMAACCPRCREGHFVTQFMHEVMLAFDGYAQVVDRNSALMAVAPGGSA